MRNALAGSFASAALLSAMAASITFRFFSSTATVAESRSLAALVDDVAHRADLTIERLLSGLRAHGLYGNVGTLASTEAESFADATSGAAFCLTSE